MIGDLRDVAPGQTLDADVCIAGAGAAGICLALQLAERGRKVLLLEGGGFDYEPESQDCYVGRNIGRDYFELDECRLRYLGGTTNHWGGMCAPLMAHDFSVRPWVPHSGWPIDYRSFLNYYARAVPIINTGSPRYDRPGPMKKPLTPLPALDPAKLEARMYRLSRPVYRPAEQFRRELETRAGLRLLLHANLVRVQLSPDTRRVVGFVLAGPDGRRVQARARTYVLALGGIENARMMLVSNDVARAGVGNGRDLVGRFFLEHAELRLGVCYPKGDWSPAFLRHNDRGGRFWKAIVNTPAQQAREKVLNCGITLDTMETPRTKSQGFTALRKLKDDALGVDVVAGGSDLWNVLTDLDGAYQGYQDFSQPPLEVFGRVELAPDPDCRVALDTEKDHLGLPRITLDWRFGELEHRTMRIAAMTMAAEFGRLGLGRVQLPEWLTGTEAVFPPDLEGGYHHMGTTRMAADPARGVVDPDCKVFGVEGLYVAGSSVWPTGGYANPTLSIVAMTLRLADHLRGVLA